MPSLKSIRKRIGSVKNTQKITRAMKLVAAAKLRRAQDAIIAARPYARALERVVSELAEKAGPGSHPLFAERGSKRAVIVLMTSDRGLAGSFNAQIIRAVEQFVDTELAEFDDVSLRVAGRKGRDYFRRSNAKIRSFVEAPTSQSALDVSRELANVVIEDFLPDAAKDESSENAREGVDRVYLFYNEFKSAMTQGVVIKQMLPVVPVERPADEDAADDLRGDFLYEPSKQELLDHLVPLYVQNGFYRAALESIASEFGSRMTAMDSATRNAGEMISKLTLQYNRARQAAITKELMEIIGGAEALKG